MRKFTRLSIFFAIFIASAVLLFAEENQKESSKVVFTSNAPSNHEIYMGYGYPSSISPLVVHGIQNILTEIFSGGNNQTKLISFGVSQLGYNWYCYKGLALGGIVTVEPYRTKHISKEKPEYNHFDTSVISTIQASIRYQYGWNMIRLYHGFSAGLGIATMIQNENTSSTCIFIMNFIPVGIKVGKEKGINFFADVGIGSTPIINIGANYRF